HPAHLAIPATFFDVSDRFFIPKKLVNGTLPNRMIVCGLYSLIAGSTLTSLQLIISFGKGTRSLGGGQLIALRLTQSSNKSTPSPSRVRWSSLPVFPCHGLLFLSSRSPGNSPMIIIFFLKFP